MENSFILLIGIVIGVLLWERIIRNLENKVIKERKPDERRTR